MGVRSSKESWRGLVSEVTADRKRVANGNERGKEKKRDKGVVDSTKGEKGL